jgi:dipeptidase D
MRHLNLKARHLMMVLAAMSMMTFNSCKNEEPEPTPTPEEAGTEAVLKFFKEVNAVPRPSMHEDKMRDYLKSFAAARNLRCVEDNGNIIIYKDATSGMAGAPMVCLQTHMDMVCAAAEGYEIDFETQGIEQEVEGNLIHSKGYKTSLGADDGIGVANVLAVLDSKTISHGPLECLFTWNEEQGMDGAKALSEGLLKSKYLFNIDWEQEGEICVGTAGGEQVEITLNATAETIPTDYAALQIAIRGLTGGHSGVNITTGSGNAIKLMGDFLKTHPAKIASINGGTFPNSIAEFCTCVVAVPAADKENYKQALTAYQANMMQKFAKTDPGMSITISEVSLPSQCLSTAHSTLVANGLADAPQGVTEWSTTVSGMFEASNNVGVIALTDGQLKVNYYARGFHDEKIAQLVTAIDEAWLIGSSEANSRHFGGFSPWSPSPMSSLLQFAQDTYRARFQKPIMLQIVGGGLELSEFSVKYPDMQFLSFGPTIHDPHTPNETVEISSIEPCWQFLVGLLKNIENVNNK